MADDFSQRAARGQAYNLAVLTAIADGKQHDTMYVTKQFLRHLQFASILQKESPENLATAMDNPKILELMSRMEAELQCMKG